MRECEWQFRESERRRRWRRRRDTSKRSAERSVQWMCRFLLPFKREIMNNYRSPVSLRDCFGGCQLSRGFRRRRPGRPVRRFEIENGKSGKVQLNAWTVRQQATQRIGGGEAKGEFSRAVATQSTAIGRTAAVIHSVDCPRVDGTSCTVAALHCQFDTFSISRSYVLRYSRIRRGISEGLRKR